ncbi:MAG: hypothetical protein K6E53_16400 [Lachnospiraceae bacterium]|nr:hypothetical protein [Lachnospiraceae bacterium]
MKKEFRSILSKAIIIAFAVLGFIIVRPITAYADSLGVPSATIIEGPDYLTLGNSATYIFTLTFSENVEERYNDINQNIGGDFPHCRVDREDYSLNGNKYTVTLTIRIDGNETASGTDLVLSWNHNEIARKSVTFKAPLTITAKNKSYPYNGEMQGPGDTTYDDPADIAEWVSVEGLQSGDTLTCITVDGQGREAGEYDLVPRGALINGENPDNRYDVTYVNGILTITDPSPRARPRDNGDYDHHEDAPAPVPKPVNPNAVIGMSFIGTPTGSVKIGPQVQGVAAQLAFRMNTPAGWKEAFTFNMTVNDKADYSLKKGTLSFRIPSQYLKAGRKFAILGIDKNGNVKLFSDIDINADTITVNLFIEGYAFDLIYSD